MDQEKRGQLENDVAVQPRGLQETRMVVAWCSIVVALHGCQPQLAIGSFSSFSLSHPALLYSSHSPWNSILCWSQSWLFVLRFPRLLHYPRRDLLVLTILRLSSSPTSRKTGNWKLPFDYAFKRNFNVQTFDSKTLRCFFSFTILWLLI